MTGEIIAVALGLLVGLSLGALGGGGSTLAVPILVFVAGLQAQDATTASLLVVGVASAFGVVSHFRNGNVRLGAGIAFGAVRMYRSIDKSEPAGEPLDEDRPVANSTGIATKQRVSVAPRLDLSMSALAKLAGAATAVGLLTGLFGVGGGFAVVPALTLLLKFPAKQAIGTSLVVIVINATIALAMRSGNLGFDWAVVGPFLVTVTVGVVAVYTAASTIISA